jgi:glycosyltransferase involved in cell wall biosynthesis
LIAKLGYDVEDVPAFEFVTERQSHEDLIRFHHEGNCFVTAARGEGWNLPAFEAAILGNPVIAPGFSGHTDFLGDYCNGHLYDCQLTPAITQDLQIQDAIEVGGFRIQPVHRVEPSGISARQRWGEPDINELALVMRSLYTAKTPRDFSSRLHFEYKYGYERVGELLCDHLDPKPQTKIESEESCETSSTS